MSVLNKIKSLQGRDIEFCELPCDNPEKTVLLIGVFHGDEPQGKYLIERYVQENNRNTKNRVLYISCLNPDGMHLNTRQNANGIDLNRNFPTKNYKITDNEQYFGGVKPASEVETKFLIEILENYKIDIILSLHAPYRIVNYDGPALEYAEVISKYTGYPVEGDIGYETLGSFGTYAGIERKIPTITLELPDDETNETLWTQTKEVFEYFANKF